jgi:UDP-2,3-diacylglucosamine hydrolase
VSNGEILFVSDLHLDRKQPELTARFIDFLETRAASARVLYILGDLFEIWLGDDDPAGHFTTLFDALARFAEQRTLRFMHGNRDFLVGEALARRIGFGILDDPTVIELDGRRVGLMHGDLLCSDDVDYLKFRSMVRDPRWREDFLSQPLERRQAIAEGLRERSQQAMSGKRMEIMDVNPQTVAQTLEQLDVAVLIHGHTHRPGMHRIGDRQRIVLGDWSPGRGPSYLSWRDGRFRLTDPRC